ncbi:MAG: FAD-dependent monooxygenase, partial [Pseudomonadota bacterium]
MNAKGQNTDIVILGAGLIGLTQALTLAAHGLRIAVIDRAPASDLLDPRRDARVSAINSSSWKMFDAIGLTDELEPNGCPIRQIVINDGLKPGKLDFRPDEDDDPLGVMVENGLLRRILYEAAEASDHVELLMNTAVTSVDRTEHHVRVSLGGGQKITAPLLIAADGRGSAMREQAGIVMAKWQYDHSAIICTVAHQQPHGNSAYEIFYSGGPFAILPMRDNDGGEHQSAIVWTVARQDGPALAKINARAFQAELMKKSGGFL